MWRDLSSHVRFVERDVVRCKVCRVRCVERPVVRCVRRVERGVVRYVRCVERSVIGKRVFIYGFS